MKHVRGRYLTVALVSAAAGSLAAGAFGLSAATAGDPAPIRLDVEQLEQPVAPVPIDDTDDVPAVVSAAEVTPATVATPTATSIDSPPANEATPTSRPDPAPAVEPAPRPTTVAPAAPVIDADSDDSPASVDSIDS